MKVRWDASNVRDNVGGAYLSFVWGIGGDGYIPGVFCRFRDKDWKSIEPSQYTYGEVERVQP